ncbi:MAG: cobalt-precorrin-5B (C(1))-methyltransferase [Nitrospinaceae bacterium]|jgi:cobalt-precorrin-5B (C1)-methyltransferase|nr:cobalt-precorrin-5B (C(1))-methyltransferase [Nitrospinaceae bacterium]MBT3432926.1 cobalt-precorrin-5B (C(1))-methyltransferase [Nitrospinaceae bacterium]MBT3822559.1 cobalt-precorrin-5B (C(1))-methyltransferase [Nitrospinaceae bacterium]MBT4093424.1 cobalt-precorrin-5B (C(1))-methyltransferase [Nitrospinaceae bacterium]MBT4431614.1 cobalt-precorrin-5B (C(1))-methyltransferase [Nitrospinaceae bacterium]
MVRNEVEPLRRGWTTGACATAAAKAAYTALLTGKFPDPVAIILPKGERPSFSLAIETLGEDFARAGIVKDAGDDPDVTHGALVIVTLRRCEAGAGVIFRAGGGVGTVTKPGLPVEVGEPAINPAPRRMMIAEIESLARVHGEPGDIEIEISVPGGEGLAQKTWNPRLGILGGISILGTTGVVIPYSCSAWIHSIHRGIDVARATGLEHLAGCTGSTSESAVQAMYGLSDGAMLDMGDFAGGMLKYLKLNPVPRLTIGGGFGKLAKLAQGHLDLHSGRSQVDFDWLARQMETVAAPSEICQKAKEANTANEVLEIARTENLPLADHVASLALETTVKVLEGVTIQLEVLIFDRKGVLSGRSGQA